MADTVAQPKAAVDALRIGIAADHGGYELKSDLSARLAASGCGVRDFGANSIQPGDDYPDFVVPLAKAISRGELDRGIAICSSGVGACVAANKIPGVRACLISEEFSARQGVEDDNLNLICLGGQVVGRAAALELVEVFLAARFSGQARHVRRLGKISDLEKDLGGR